MSPEVGSAFVMAAVAASCAVPGVFLVLRRAAMIADAVTHVLLFGVVVAYFVTRDLNSPWLMLGATLSGVGTVALVEAIRRTKLVAEDAAIGLVFPALFSVGTLLASVHFRDTHLDVDAVLKGSAEFAYLDTLPGTDLPRAGVVAGVLFLLNAVLAVVFFKELKLATFDAGLAAALGFAPAAVHYALMTAVSLTAVAAFDAVGPVLVVAFLVVPAAAAYLLTDSLGILLALSVGIGVLSATAGVYLAFALETNMAGTTASVLGMVFAGVLIAAPTRGLVAVAVRRHRQTRRFEETMLAVHLATHEGTPAEPDEAATANVHRHLRWPATRAAAVMRRAERRGLVTRAGELLTLTPAGRDRVTEVLDRP